MYVHDVKLLFFKKTGHEVKCDTIPTSGHVSMGSMGSAEPIDFEKWVPEPINFSGFINTGSAE